MSIQTQTNKSENARQELWLIYFAAFGANIVAIAALDSYLRDAAFTLSAMVVIALGFYESLQRRLDFPFGVPSIIRCLIAAVFAGQLLQHTFSYNMVSMNSFESSGTATSIMITIIMLLLSFFQISNEMLLFSSIPPLALIGLTGTMGQDEVILGYFVLYMIFITMMILRLPVMLDRKFIIRKNLPFGTHAGMALAIVAISLLIGFLLGRTVFDPIDKRILKRIIGQFSLPAYMVQDINDTLSVGPTPITSDEELMTLECSEPVLLRGQIFTFYDGSAWRDKRSLASDLTSQWPIQQRPKSHYDGIGECVYTIDDNPLDGVRKNVRPLHQTISISHGYYRMVFGAAEIRALQFERHFNVYITDELIATSRIRGEGDRYRVESLVSNASPTELRAAASSYPNYIIEWYTQIPPFEDDVDRLSKQICTGLSNPYDKAVAIQRYLEQNYTYDLNASIDEQHADVISDFLFKTKRGHCTLFATAMAMLSRHAGIPARLATGFTSGRFDESRGVYSITAADKHAWAELYFPGYGWIAFDPTAASVNSSIVEKIEKAMRNAIGFLISNRNTIIVVAIIVLLAFYLIKTEVLTRIKRPTISKEEEAILEISRAYRKMCKILSRYGYPKGISETPLEYAKRIESAFGADLPWMSNFVNAITSDLIYARYAGAELSEERIKTHSLEIRNLSRKLRSEKRRNKIDIAGFNMEG